MNRNRHWKYAEMGRKTYNSGNTSTMEPEGFLISPPKLKILASQEMSLIHNRRLAQNEPENEKFITNDDRDCNFRRNLKDIIDDVMPAISDIIDSMPTIYDMINDYIDDPISGSIIKWRNYHQSYVFFDCGFHDGFMNCIDDFVLKHDGCLNFQSTAKNVLMNDKLNLVEKFRLASLYCLTDDIRRLWPAVRDNPQITECEAEDNPMVRYWICVMKGESPRFPGTRSDSFEGYIAVLNSMEILEWSSIEYFWNALSSDEQVTVAKNLLSYVVVTEDATFIEPLFLRLNKTQFRRVMEEIEIGDVLFRPAANYRCTYLNWFEIWDYLKYFISSVKFHELIFFLVSNIFPYDIRQVYTFLFEMWTSAPDQFRYSFLNNSDAVRSIFQGLSSQGCWDTPFYFDTFYDMRFFVAVLTELSFQSRNALWHEFWPNIIVYASSKCLDHMMRLCFNNDDEIIQFKERYMLNYDKIHDFCNLCISKRYISKLQDYLSFCSSNEPCVASVKRKIIKSKRIQSKCAKHWKFYGAGFAASAFIDFDKFVDGAFFHENDARDFKKKLFKSNATLRAIWKIVGKTRLGIDWV